MLCLVTQDSPSIFSFLPHSFHLFFFPFPLPPSPPSFFSSPSSSAPFLYHLPSPAPLLPTEEESEEESGEEEDSMNVSTSSAEPGRGTTNFTSCRSRGMAFDGLIPSLVLV